jgi:hypothetical protein
MYGHVVIILTRVIKMVMTKDQIWLHDYVWTLVTKCPSHKNHILALSRPTIPPTNMLGKGGPLGPLSGSLGGGLSIGPLGGGPSNYLLGRGYPQGYPYNVWYTSQCPIPTLISTSIAPPQWERCCLIQSTWNICSFLFDASNEIKNVQFGVKTKENLKVFGDRVPFVVYPNCNPIAT